MEGGKEEGGREERKEGERENRREGKRKKKRRKEGRKIIYNASFTQHFVSAGSLHCIFIELQRYPNTANSESSRHLSHTSIHPAVTAHYSFLLRGDLYFRQADWIATPFYIFSALILNLVFFNFRKTHFSQ